MNIKLYKGLVVLAIAFISLVGFSGCTKKITEEYYSVGSEVITRDYEVLSADDWGWNPIYNRYEYTFDAKEIDLDLYKYGTIVATVFVDEKDGKGGTYQVQKNLPFIQTYKDLVVPYSEIISFDISYGNPSTVTFYIQATDGASQSPYLMGYNFKVAYIWDSEG